MKITVLTDSLQSWFIPYGKMLVEQLQSAGHEAQYVFAAKDVTAGDVCFLLSCVRLVPLSVLGLNKNNIVVHASDLPKGKGFSPLQWQILEGSNEIPLTLFEVVEGMDAGPYYIKETLHCDGTELLDELREKMALAINEMCLRFVAQRDTLEAIPQSGEETIYRRRRDADDELNIHRSIAEQFNHLRIADNEAHPLYFHYKDKKYILKIYKETDATGN